MLFRSMVFRAMMLTSPDSTIKMLLSTVLVTLGNMLMISLLKLDGTRESHRSYRSWPSFSQLGSDSGIKAVKSDNYSKERLDRDRQ